MKKLGFLIVMASLLLVSCNIQERIAFDEGMGGTFENTIDLSPLMQMAGSTSAEAKKEKVDTLVVFNDYLEIYKDSIATLPKAKQQELAQLKNMTMHMVMDDETQTMIISTTKTFNSFSEIETVSNQMDQVFNFAKLQGPDAKTAGPSGDMLKQDKVRYTFTDNVFRRVDQQVYEEEKAEKNNIELIPEVLSEEDQQAEDMMKGMMSQFEDMLKQSKISLEYTFPKNIKSVSTKDAKISDDGKTVVYSMDWKTLMDNKELLENFEVKLED